MSIKVNTSGFGGRKLSKSATVYTNDKNRPRIELKISGNVDRFATITPESKSIKLSGLPNQEIVSSAIIIPEPKYPFKILETKAAKGENIEFKLDTVKKDSGTEYVLTIKNLKKDKGRYFDTISLKTDSVLQPEIKLSVYGNISDPDPKPSAEPAEKKE